MRAHETSRTALWVAAGRALATARQRPAACCDPLAVSLLPEHLREAVEARAAGRWPLRPAAFGRACLVDVTSCLMGPRTAAIDAHLGVLQKRTGTVAGDTAPVRQLVILGAGLDLRAHRLEALRHCTVFEVDHPATQADKRARVAGLERVAAGLVYVPLDFTRWAPRTAHLDEALAKAGHRSDQPTIWLWEGVITYLTMPDIHRTLAAIRRRSAPDSRLIATYNAPSLVRLAMRAITALTPEPHHTMMTPVRMKQLLATYDFTVLDDTGGLERAARFAKPAGPVDQFWTRGHHVVVAARRRAPGEASDAEPARQRACRAGAFTHARP